MKDSRSSMLFEMSISGEVWNSIDLLYICFYW
jgi:hypothetical protein